MPLLGSGGQHICTYINGLNDNLMEYSNMTRLSMQHLKQSSPFITVIVSPLIQSAVGILLDSRNASTVGKPTVACVTTIQ